MSPLVPNDFAPAGIDIAWCPGCGNFAILKTLQQSLAALSISPDRLVLVSGIGQAAKTPQYVRANYFNGLHGRALPAATAIKAVDPSLTVIVTSGDGDMYGEGGNHFMHAIRRNPDITVLVHDNMVYGLTKGQASPTSRPGMVTPVQVEGVFEQPFNPVAAAIVLGAPFVARASAGEPALTAQIIQRAVAFKGFALVDILQPCVTFNKINTYQWFKDNSYILDPAHRSGDRAAALAEAMRTDRLGLGVLYEDPSRTVFEENLAAYHAERTPLPLRSLDRRVRLRRLMEAT